MKIFLELFIGIIFILMSTELVIALDDKKPAEIPNGSTPKLESKLIPGQDYSDPATGINFIFVRGGCFQMGDTFGDGSADEKPIHEACVDDFYIGKHEITQGQWKNIMGNNPSKFKDCGNDCPVEMISWNDVQEFIKKLKQKTGGKYRLPTEAEWEYAAKSGGKNENWSGTSNPSEIEEYAWYTKNSGWKTYPVGQKKPNGIGLYDMSGNVWEWTADWYDSKAYKNSPKENPNGPESGRYKVLRGGSWFDSQKIVRTSNRNKNRPEKQNSYFGFRLVISKQ